MLLRFGVLDPKEAEGPFPWKHRLHGELGRPPSSPTTSDEPADLATSVKDFLAKYMERAPGSEFQHMKVQCPHAPPKQGVARARAAESQRLILLTFRLAAYGSVAGKCLQHARAELQRLVDEEGPLIFKIGFTHDPLWRICSPLYGYWRDLDSWTNMLILYASSEPYSAGMLEASLIDRFRGILVALLVGKCIWKAVHVMHPIAIRRFPMCSPGVPGCRNVKLGGDNIKDGDTLDAAYMTYVVYRSFRKPPAKQAERV